ncbi:MAG: CNNM domain-containing protein, partial [Pirellulaceae bacterium]
MTPGLLLILTFLSIAVMATSATAAQVLQEFWRHELEDYCRRRGRLSWFTQIIELRRELTLGAQTLQMISIATSVTCGFLYFFSSRSIDDVSAFALLGLIGLWSLILLAANCWIPWGVLRIAAPQFLFATWRLWWLVSLALSPLIAGVEVVSSLFQRLSGQPEEEENEEENFEDEIMSIVSEGEHDGLLEA